MTGRPQSRTAGMLVVAAILAGLGAPAEARTFHVLGAKTDAFTIIDPEAIEEVPGGAMRKTWTVTVHRNILSGSPPQPGYVRALNEYDCEGQALRWRSFSVFSRAGILLVSRNNPRSDWQTLTPNSPAFAEWRLVCGYAKGNSVISAEGVAKVVVGLMAAWDMPPAPAKPAAPKR